MHACARSNDISMYQAMPQAWFMLNEHMGYALVQQSPVLFETELGMRTRGVIMGMYTDGCLSIWQFCEYCLALLNDAVHMHDVLWEGLEADTGVIVLWQGACACPTQLSCVST